jgi:hypothetical protein
MTAAGAPAGRGGSRSILARGIGVAGQRDREYQQRRREGTDQCSHFHNRSYSPVLNLVIAMEL